MHCNTSHIHYSCVGGEEGVGGGFHYRRMAHMASNVVRIITRSIVVGIIRDVKKSNRAFKGLGTKLFFLTQGTEQYYHWASPKHTAYVLYYTY